MAISKNNETLEREPSTMQSTRVAGPHKAVCYLSSWEKKTKKHTSKKKRYYNDRTHHLKGTSTSLPQPQKYRI